jgi:hypothetical protein
MSKKIGTSSKNDINKKLKILLSCCKRLEKEVLSYEREVVTNEARVQKMKEDQRDEYGIYF